MEVDRGGIDFCFLCPCDVSYKQSLIIIITVVITMTIRGLARKFKIPYSTARKYLKLLENNGFIRIRQSEHGTQIDDYAVSIFEEFLELVKAGNTLQTALEKLAEGSTGPAHVIIDHLKRLERRIEELEKENRALRDIVQKYLAEIEKLKSLPPPRKSLWQRFKDWWKKKS